MKFDVDIKLRVSVDDGVKFCVRAERLEEEISNILNDWSDGRYPFNVELLKKGAEGVVQGAVEEVVVRAMYKAHGSAMIKSVDGTSSTAKAILEAEKLLDGVRVRLLNEREDLVGVQDVKELAT